MSEHYDFHYQPTGSGAISGQQVLEQTEDAINELGDYVNDNVGGAMDVAQQALETAQNAETDAQTALDTANSFSSAIQSAQQDASTALSTAQTAQTTASNANNTAIQAQQDASSAVTTANNASGQVSTLSGTVTTLGQRVTTAEGNIGQNTSDITALTTRVGTAEGNITTLQNDVTIAQGNASSAMATAGQVKQQAFVFRYSSTVLVASSTNANSLLDNTDNLKVGDKVIDSSGVLFSITAIDTENSTFTIGTALIDLAQDSDVVHKSGKETIGGIKTFTDPIQLKSNVAEYGVTGGNIQFYLMDKNSVGLSKINQGVYNNGASYITLQLYGKDSNNQTVTNSIIYKYSSSFNNTYLLPTDNSVWLGSTDNRFGKIYGTEYYYGSNNIEFSTKFVTTDTDQTISSLKTFAGLRTEFKRVNGDGVILCSNGSFTKGSAPNSIVNICRKYYGDTTSIGSALGYSSVSVDNNGNKTIYQFYCIDNTSGSTSRTTIQMNYDKSLSGTDAQYINISGSLLPSTNNSYNLGNSTNKWATINGLNPSSLGMPDLDNGIDISSYITVVANANKESLYTPTVNGWISVALTRTGGANMAVMLKQGNFASSGHNIAQENGTTTCSAMLPVKGGVQVSINSALADGIAFAYFYPCQGNV